MPAEDVEPPAGAVAAEFVEVLRSTGIDGRLMHARTVIWHNFDQAEVTLEQYLEHKAASGQTRRPGIENVRFHPTANGCAIQYELTLGSLGTRVPAAMFLEISGGTIDRMDEYVDSRQVREAMSPAASGE